jgi:hypothetical protein
MASAGQAEEEEGQALMAKLAKRFRSQVKAESQLRFGPGRRQAKAEKREAKQTYRGDVRAAKAQATGTRRAARAAQPVLQGIGAEAQGMVNAGPSPQVAVGQLGDAAMRDAEGTRRRLAETMALARAELVAREQDAIAGRNLAIGSARDRRDSSIATANQTLRGIAQDAGAFRQGRTGELIETVRERRHETRLNNADNRTSSRNNRRTTTAGERNNLRSTGIDPDTGAVIRGGKLDPDGNGKRGDQSKGKGKGKGSKPASPSRVEGATSAIDLGRSQVRDLLKGKEKRTKEEALALLTTGRQKATLQQGETKVPIPGITKVKSIFAKAAVELEYDGYVSASTRKRLKALGYTPQQIGLPKVGGAGQGGGRNSAPGANGQRRPT